MYMRTWCTRVDRPKSRQEFTKYKKVLLRERKRHTARRVVVSTHSVVLSYQALVKAATRGTAMVVTVSVAFILLTAPTAVSEALFGWWNPLRHSFPLLRAFAIFTHYLNHSINGLLYCIVGSRFREEVFRIFHRKRIPQSVSVSHSVNHTGLAIINESASWGFMCVRYLLRHSVYSNSLTGLGARHKLMNSLPLVKYQ